MTAQIAMAPSVTTMAPKIGWIGVEVERVGEEIAGEGAQHVDVAVREVDEAQHPVHHRVAERDEGVDRAERQPVDQLLEERVHD